MHYALDAESSGFESQFPAFNRICCLNCRGLTASIQLVTEDLKTILRAMWTKTKIPMTRTNAVAYAEAIFGVEPTHTNPALDVLIVRGIVLSEQNDGEELLLIPGEQRPQLGPRTLAEAVTLERLEREANTAIAVKTPAWLIPRAREEQPADQKSVLAAGALSFVFGPIGWLYAAPWKEALPAIGMYVLVSTLAAVFLPSIVVSILGGAGLVASALIGMVYANRFNKTGKRTQLIEPRNK